ncbi:hypothetical protein FLGE108171_10155 [Flavobacterium gelidilacus]|uniref:hypothetical protein n=1 Tax=Flavobacterium gelidilacus TaxID=206041 RepID=UPI00040CB8F6|nr:hypothetical protein [Flavobacterium gelidilacus]
MYRKKDSLLNYKEGVKQKFKVERKGEFASFLLNPSRALLRDLCIQRMKNNSSKEDLKTFALFFGFEFEHVALNKLKANTDKFRPIETFLKGETDLSSTEGINLAAILVDYQPRPYLKFNKSDLETDSIDFNENEIIVLEKETINLVNKSNSSLKKKIGIAILSAVGLFSVGYTAKEIVSPTKQCMQWQVDHYEQVDCDVKGIVSFNYVVPIDEHQFKLKKIEVDSNFIFFKGKKPIVFYCKVNGKPEFFNQLGKHPETEQVLKEVTPYIIDKYVKNKKD